ncbi:MAG: hypothetical protein ABUL49_02145, partial [bacterium]
MNLSQGRSVKMDAMRRWLWTLSLVALPLFASADGLSDARVQLASIFDDLATMNDYWFESSGTVTVGETTHTLADYVGVSSRDITVNDSPANQILVETQSYKDGVLTRRVVADGDYVWDYDAVTNTYRVTYYGNSVTGGSKVGDKSFTYIDTVRSILRSRAAGPSAMLLQTVEQALLARTTSGAEVANNWEPFLASSDISVDNDNKQILCTHRTHEVNPMDMVYKWTTVVTDTPNQYLNSLHFRQSKTLPTGEQVTDWTSTLHRSEVMDGATYTFN